MALFVKGDAVANATSYELLEKVGSAYKSLATASEINFEVSAMGFSAGDHTLVVKAKADGYAESDYSNEVVYTVEGGIVSADIMNYNSEAFLSATDGSLIASTGDYKKVSDYVEIPSGLGISAFSSITTINAGNAYCAFYDEDKAFISAYVPQSTDGVVTGTWRYTETPPEIPSGAKYIRVAFNNGLDNHSALDIVKREYAILVFGTYS